MTITTTIIRPDGSKVTSEIMTRPPKPDNGSVEDLRSVLDLKLPPGKKIDLKTKQIIDVWKTGRPKKNKIPQPWESLVTPATISSVDRLIASAEARNKISPIQKRQMRKKMAERVRENLNRERRVAIIAAPEKPKKKNEIFRGIAPDAPPKKTVERKCMGCPNTVLSEGPHHRLCAHCRNKSED